jgi:hypothetical protein
MNRAESLRAADELGRSPAAKWIGNRIDGKILLQKCTRCGAEEKLEMPAALLFAFQGGKRGDALASQVPDDFDAKLFAWKKAFQVAHEGCLERGPEAA